MIHEWIVNLFFLTFLFLTVSKDNHFSIKWKFIIICIFQNEVFVGTCIKQIPTVATGHLAYIKMS